MDTYLTYGLPATAIVGYTFNADTYCRYCVVDALTSSPEYDGWQLADGVRMSTEQDLDEIAAAFGVDRTDESSYDSGDFPKIVFASDADDDDACGCCGSSLL